MVIYGKLYELNINAQGHTMNILLSRVPWLRSSWLSVVEIAQVMFKCSFLENGAIYRYKISTPFLYKIKGQTIILGRKSPNNNHKKDLLENPPEKYCDQRPLQYEDTASTPQDLLYPKT